MKKTIIIAGIIIVILLTALLLVPFLFTDQIAAVVKKEANRNLTARLNFEDVGLSFFKQFPRLTVTLDRLTIVNQEPFAGDTLMNIGEFQATVNLASLFGDGPLEVNSILLERPRMNFKILPDGRANWNITREAAPSQTAEPAGSSGLNLALENYQIRDGFLSYRDGSNDQHWQLEGLTHRGKGDFQASQFTLSTETLIENILLQMNETTYLNQASLQARIDVDVDMEQGRYAFKENSLRLNELGLNLDGWVAQQGENLTMDLRFDAPEADFKDILSMIPFVYRQDFADLQTAGKLTLRGTARGLLSESEVPAFDLLLNISDGMLQYPDLPTPVKQVQVDLQVRNPGKTADHTVIELQKLHLEILQEPLDARMLIKNPVSDPYLDAAVKGRLNLGEVKNVFPLEPGVTLDGRLRSDFQLRGALSAIQKNQIEGFSTGGTLEFNDVKYAAPDLPEPVAVNSATLNFSPQKAALNNFRARLGKSDLQANGVLENIFGYVFHDQTVKGTLAVQSNFFDLNPWLAGESEPLRPVVLPANIEFLLDGNFREVIFDNLTLTNVKSQMLLRDQALNLIEFSAGLLEGSFTTNGTYSYLPPAPPKIFFDMALEQINIPAAFEKFVTVQKFLPIAEYMQGQVSGKLNLNTNLDQTLMPVWSDFFSKGEVTIPKLKISDFKPLNKVAETLKINRLSNPALSGLNPRYLIKNGRFYLQPVTFTVDQYQVVAAGSNGIDKTIDYSLKVHLPAAEMKKQANAFVSQLVKQDLGLFTNETIIVDVNMGGSVNDPQVSASLNEVVKGAADPLKSAAMSEAEKQKSELDKQKQELLDKQKQEMEEKKKEAEKKLKDKLKDLFKKKD